MKLYQYAALSCLAIAACNTTTRDAGSHDSLMSNLSAAQRRPIDEARSEQDRRTDAMEASRQAIVRAKAERDLARKNLDVAEANVAQAEAALSVAQTGTPAELQAAGQDLSTAKADVLPKREVIRWHDTEIARCERASALAKREEALAAARVDLAKAHAFAGVDNTSARAVDVAHDEASVSEAQKQVAIASAELDAATRDCAMARGVYEKSLAGRTP